jgi:hypothetical protein
MSTARYATRLTEWPGLGAMKRRRGPIGPSLRLGVLTYD